MFDNIEKYCMFIGYGKSGHTLIGCLLDAHPNVIIATELDALKEISLGISREALFHKLLSNSKQFVTKRNCMWTGYSYRVPGQYQGTFTELKVIGDKKGGMSSLRLRDNQQLLNKVQETVKVEIKFLHIMRNPFDIVATFYKQNSVDMNQTMKFVLEQIEGTAQTKASLSESDIFEMRHEDFIMTPKKHLVELCDFLDIEPHVDYIEACSGIVKWRAHKSRSEIQWPHGSVDYLQNEIKKYDFLEGYSFDEN